MNGKNRAPETVPSRQELVLAASQCPGGLPDDEVERGLQKLESEAYRLGYQAGRRGYPAMIGENT